MVPISEIAFVLARDANAINAIDNHVFNLILNVVIISMIVGPLAASLSGPIYKLFRRLKPEQPIKGKNLSEQGLSGHLVLVGTEKYTNFLVRAFKRRKSPFLIIEPLYQSFFELSKKGFPVIYGEADKTDILQAAHVDKAKMLIIFESETFSSPTVIEKAQRLNPELPIILLTKLASVKENWRKNQQVRVIILEKQIAERIARLVIKELKTA